MCTLYVANTTAMTQVLPCPVVGVADAYVHGYGLPGLAVGPGKVVSTANLLQETVDSIVSGWQRIGIGKWTGSGVGYSIDAPITL